jgi:hypothetical protein
MQSAGLYAPICTSLLKGDKVGPAVLTVAAPNMHVMQRRCDLVLPGHMLNPTIGCPILGLYPELTNDTQIRCKPIVAHHCPMSKVAHREQFASEIPHLFYWQTCFTDPMLFS